MTNGPGRLPDAALDALETALAPVDAWTAARWPGATGSVQPIHTVCVPADRAAPGICAAWGREALAALDEHAPGPVSLAMATGLPADEVEDAWPHLRRVLETRPVEDLRLDLDLELGAGAASSTGPGNDPWPEDADLGPAAGGTGDPPGPASPGTGRDAGPTADDAEDALADEAVRTLLAEVAAEDGPLRCGVRHRGLDAATRRRAVRTLDRVIGGLAEAGGPPEGFLLTLPGVVHVDQVAAYSALLRVLEVAHDLPEDRLAFELQIDAPQAVLDADGRVPVGAMLDIAGGRCVGLHLGTVAYTGTLGVPDDGRRTDHPDVRTARSILRLAVAGTGVEISDGPVAPPVGDDRADAHAHWKSHAELVLRALQDGVPRGWDAHPAQLVTRHLVGIVAARRGAGGG